jgi:signal transduction histidine kinase
MRWLINTLGVILALGMVCVLALTAIFSNYYYSNMRSDLYDRAESTAAFFAEYLNQSYNEYYQSCITYAQTFSDKDRLELQFISKDGTLVASSYGQWAGQSPVTDEIQEAIQTRAIRPYLGADPITGERIMAVSSPMIYSNGEVIGVLRFVTSTGVMDVQIFQVFLMSLLALVVILVIVLISGEYFMRSIMIPVQEITEKAQQIANGSYGAQIQTRYRDEIGVLADTVNDLSIKISQNEKMQAGFISQLSHELRTPLTVIKGWCETLMMDEGMDEMTSQGMKTIHGESGRMIEMVTELLDFTRMQGENVTLTMEMEDIRSSFEETVFMYASRLGTEGIELNYLDNDDEIPEIRCDVDKLRQVFLNILDNAAKHGGDGKRIEASIHYVEGCVVVRIRDYGPGIPEDEIPLVKKKFFKGSSKARGTGIGLAVCDEIVELHGGSLTLENAEGGGTLVTVTLPESE